MPTSVHLVYQFLLLVLCGTDVFAIATPCVVVEVASNNVVEIIVDIRDKRRGRRHVEDGFGESAQILRPIGRVLNVFRMPFAPIPESSGRINGAKGGSVDKHRPIPHGLDHPNNECKWQQPIPHYGPGCDSYIPAIVVANVAMVLGIREHSNRQGGCAKRREPPSLLHGGCCCRHNIVPPRVHTDKRAEAVVVESIPVAKSIDHN